MQKWLLFTKCITYVNIWKESWNLLCVMQVSLNKLMETLGQSEPYFVKCIRSNAEKVSNESRFCYCVTVFRRSVWSASFFRSFLCVSTTRWCWDSYATPACWRRSGSAAPDTASNTASRWHTSQYNNNYNTTGKITKDYLLDNNRLV